MKARKMPHRRRREGKTDYRKRLKLLSSDAPRLVIRKSTNNVTCQIVRYHPQGDKTMVTQNAKNLLALGWKGNMGSLPAAYLIGLLCGTEAKKKGITAATADLGMYTSTKYSRLYAALKGVIDGGVKVPHSAEILPPEDRLTGKHISVYAEKLKKEKPELYHKTFSLYVKNKVAPETLPLHVAEIKKKIMH